MIFHSKKHVFHPKDIIHDIKVLGEVYYFDGDQIIIMKLKEKIRHHKDLDIFN